VPLAVATSSAARADLAAPELGTLVAVAVGGSCKFSVDGHSITTSSTLRLKLPPGPHVVECGSHTRSLTVRTGETSMAMFRL
jgi:eukaryotic-like serine/threonine-protein kinase